MMAHVVEHIIEYGPRWTAVLAEMRHKGVKSAIIAGNRRDNDVVVLNTGKRLHYDDTVPPPPRAAPPPAALRNRTCHTHVLASGARLALRVGAAVEIARVTPPHGGSLVRLHCSY